MSAGPLSLQAGRRAHWQESSGCIHPDAPSRHGRGLSPPPLGLHFPSQEESQLLWGPRWVRGQECVQRRVAGLRATGGARSPGGARKRGTHVVGRRRGLGWRADRRTGSLSSCARPWCGHTHKHTCAHTHTRARTHTRTLTHAHTHTCTQTCSQTHACTHVHMCTHMYAHAHRLTHTHTSSSQGPGRAALLPPLNR